MTRLTDWARSGGCAAKLGPGRLARLLDALSPTADPDRIVGLEDGDDAGVYRIGPDSAVVNTADFMPPLVDDPYSFGRIAAANALSDIYAMGGRPLTALNLVAFPRSGLGDEVLLEILRGGLERIEAAGAALVGGHSIHDEEIKYGLAVTGWIDPARVVRNGGARPGDLLLLTKPLGSGLVVQAIRDRRADPAQVAAAIESMVRLNDEAARQMLRHGVHACTDVTGFGLRGHAGEMAHASRCRLRIDCSRVPLLPGVEALCGGSPWPRLADDPQTSGGLLIAAPAATVAAIHDALNESGVEAAVIGEVVPLQSGAEAVELLY